MPDKTPERVVQAYLQNIHATSGDSLTLIASNGKEFKNDLFKKVASESGIEHKFSSPHHPHSNGILEKFHSFIKACVRKHIHHKLDWEDKLLLSLFIFGMLPDINS